MEQPGYHRGEVRLRTVEQVMDGWGEVGGIGAGWMVWRRSWKGWGKGEERG